MKRFAGVISLSPEVQGGAENAAFFKALGERFPSAIVNHERLRCGSLDIMGNIEVHASDGVTLILAGEIYNRDEIADACHLQPTATDACLLHGLIAAKGAGAAKMVNGQYVIFYCDEAAGKVTIINDHLGIQQLLYYKDEDILAFASEARLLLAHPACPGGIDWEVALKRPEPNVVLGSYRSYNTWFKGISLMPEASIISIGTQAGSYEISRHWRAQDTKEHPGDSRTAAEVMAQYAALLEDAVRIRMAAGGTTHSLLSGGLDSSAICGLAVRNGPLETFSIINQTTVLEDTTTFCHMMADELSFKNAQFLVPYHKLCFNPRLWQQRVWRAESPVNHTDSLTKTMLHYAIKSNYPEVSVLLSGTGSDQWNGGLVHYIAPAADTQEESWSAFSDAILDAENKLMIHRSEEALWQLRKFVNRDYLSSISGVSTEENPWHIYMEEATHSEAFSLLWDEQRASVSHGHITRYPFLDYRIAEFTAGIPQHLHKDLFYDKQILRGPAQNFLPHYIVNKPKKPYELPGYDFRVELFEFLTADGENSLFTAAFGDVDVPHPVIDKKHLYARIQAMRRKPEMMEWLNIMHIINLGLLEQLAGKDEQALSYEAGLDVPEHVRFDDPAAAMRMLREKLDVLTNDELIDKPLKFGTNCSLLLDLKSNKYYLSKRNNLLYELDDEYVGWRSFLLAIDNARSTRQVLEATNLAYEDIEEFFRLSLKEQILVTSDKPTGY